MKVNFNGFNENVTTFLADTSVTVVGYIRVQTASQLSVGYQKLAANAAGKVASNENGREYLVLDSDSGSAGIIL